MKVRLSALVGAALLTGALATGCSSGDSGKDAPSDAASSSTVSENPNRMGVAVKGTGATITVNAAYETDALELSNQYAAAGPGESYATDTEPRKDGKFVVVEGNVENTGTKDLTVCTRQLQTALVTDPDASYNPIDDLYQLAANENCMDDLGPGFDTDVTWVFMVPKDRKPLTFGFANSNGNPDVLTYIDLDKFGDRPKSTSTSPNPTTGNSAEDAAEPAADDLSGADDVTVDTAGVPDDSSSYDVQSTPDVVQSDPDPVIGFTGAPSVDSPHELDKQISSCGDPSIHEVGTTFFTDGTSGWTETCAAQMG